MREMLIQQVEGGRGEFEGIRGDVGQVFDALVGIFHAQHLGDVHQPIIIIIVIIIIIKSSRPRWFSVDPESFGIVHGFESHHRRRKTLDMFAPDELFEDTLEGFEKVGTG